MSPHAAPEDRHSTSPPAGRRSCAGCQQARAPRGPRTQAEYYPSCECAQCRSAAQDLYCQELTLSTNINGALMFPSNN